MGGQAGEGDEDFDKDGEWVMSFSWAQVYEGAIDRGEEAKKKALPVTGNAFWRFRYGKRTSYWSGTISGTGTDLIQGFPPQASGW